MKSPQAVSKILSTNRPAQSHVRDKTCLSLAHANIKVLVEDMCGTLAAEAEEASAIVCDRWTKC